MYAFSLIAVAAGFIRQSRPLSPTLPKEFVMSKSTYTVAALLLSLMVNIGWASDAAKPEKKYQAVYIAKVAVVADMDQNSPDEVKYYADIETEATSMLKKFFKDEGYLVVESPEPATDKLLLINTKAIFNAGNRALRWIGGIGGAGKASADVTMEAREPGGMLVSSRNAKDTLRMGGLGGSAPGMLMGTIDSAWNEVIADLDTKE